MERFRSRWRVRKKRSASESDLGASSGRRSASGRTQSVIAADVHARLASVAFRQVVRCILHPIGRVRGQGGFDRQALFNHAVKSFGLNADHAGQELNRVTREPPPEFVLHARVLAVKMPNGDEVSRTKFTIHLKTGDPSALRSRSSMSRYESGDLDAISETDQLREDPVKRHYRTSVGESCALAIKDQHMEEIRVEIISQVQGAEDVGRGTVFIPVRAIGTVGTTEVYDAVNGKTQKLTCRVTISFQFELRGLVIDVGHQDTDKLFLSVCQSMVLSQLAESNKKKVPLTTASNSNATEETDSGYPSESEANQSPAIRLSRDSRMADTSQIILDCLAMQQQVPELSAMAYLTEALFSSSLNNLVQWSLLSYNLLQLDRKYSGIIAVTDGRISSGVVCTVRQCLLSMYSILLRHTAEKTVIFPPPTTNTDVQAVVRPVSVIQTLFGCSVWKALVMDSDDGLLIKLQLTQVLEAAARVWYSSSVASSALSDPTVHEVMPVCQAFSACLKQAVDRYSNGDTQYPTAFEKLDVDYWQVCISALDELIHEDLSFLVQKGRTALTKVNKGSLRHCKKEDMDVSYELCQVFFTLIENAVYLSTKKAEVADNEGVPASVTPDPAMHCLHLVLEDLVPQWLEVVDSRCRQTIALTVATDKVISTAGAETLGISASAQEFGSMMQLISEDWECAIDWPEPVVCRLIITRMLDIICDCARTVASHSQRSMTSWPHTRLFSNKLDLHQPLIAMNNIAFVQAKVRDVPALLHLNRGNFSALGVFSPSPTPTPICSQSWNSNAFRQASQAPSIVFTGCTEAVEQALKTSSTTTSPIIKRAAPKSPEPSWKQTVAPPKSPEHRNLPDVVAPALSVSTATKDGPLTRGQGVRRSRSFKEPKSPITALGVSDSPAIVRRRTSLRRVSAPDTDRKRASQRLSTSSPDLVMLGDSLDSSDGMLSGGGTGRQTPATRLVVSSCAQDLGNMLMQMGHKIMVNYATLVDQPLGQMLADLPDAGSDMDVGVVIAPLLDYINTVMKSLGLETNLHKMSLQGLVRGLWNVICTRLLALLESSSFSNRQMLLNVLIALTMNEGVMSFLCKELAVPLSRPMLQTTPYLGLRNFIEVKSASNDGLLLLCFNSILLQEIDSATGANLNVEVEMVPNDTPCLRVIIHGGERFMNIKLNNVELESYIECALLPTAARPGGHENEIYTTVAKKGSTPEFNTTFNIPFRKGKKEKQGLLRDGLLVFCVKIYGGAATALSMDDSFFAGAGLCVVRLSRLGASGYSRRFGPPVLRVQRHPLTDSYIDEFRLRARGDRSAAELWSTWQPTLRRVP